jgi:hypothetical protein
MDTWGLRAGRWIEALKENSDLAWAGIILALSFNLETLSLEVLSDFGVRDTTHFKDVERYHPQPVEALFGLGPAFDLQLIPGLRSVSTLSLCGSNLDWAFCTLPRLKTLDLSPKPNIHDIEAMRATNPYFYWPSSAESIYFDCNTWVFRSSSNT